MYLPTLNSLPCTIHNKKQGICSKGIYTIHIQDEVIPLVAKRGRKLLYPQYIPAGY